MVASKTKISKEESSAEVNQGQQKLVDQIKKSNNILITVSRDPSVDALSAALGLTAIIDKLEKHGTAIFSGKVPSAIEFLNPDKIFEDKADSLRDFIIALSKDKADHLRYKVDGDVVKIFITPYKTVITQKDLEFTQGDYNVELVIALGIGDQKDIDVALASHGRILHDATVTTINVGDESSNLGSINLHSKEASSLSEIVAEIGKSLDEETEEDLIDEQIATALLTGIVATTDRFSNEKTTSQTMKVAAELMSAGANQQLITAKLEEADEKEQPEEGSDDADQDSEQEETQSTVGVDGSLSIAHDNKATTSRLVVSTLPPEEDNEEVKVPTATEILSQLAASQGEEAQNDEIKNTAPEALEPVEAQPLIEPVTQPPSKPRVYLTPPETETEQETDEPKEVKNTFIGQDDIPTDDTPRLSSEQSPSVGAEPLRGDTSLGVVVEPLNEIDTMAPPLVDPKPTTEADIPQYNVDASAEAILQAALNSATPSAQMTPPQAPLDSPPPITALPPLDMSTPPPPPPPVADFSTLPPPLPDFSTLPPTQPEPVHPVNQPQVGIPTPTFSTLPPEDMILAGQNPPTQSNSNDPGQFRIPGQ